VSESEHYIDLRAWRLLAIDGGGAANEVASALLAACDEIERLRLAARQGRGEAPDEPPRDFWLRPSPPEG
jgi:hypothetical protein